MSQQYCTNCGTQLKPGAVFCTGCGAPVASRSAALPGRRKGRGKLAAIIILICIALAAGAAVFVLTLGKRDEDGATETKPSSGSEKEPVAEAASIRLEQIEGTVLLTNKKGRELSVLEGMKLFDGNAVGTETESYAYLSLDRSRAAKLDMNSLADIEQDGSDLELYLREGNLFFNIDRPLDEDETLTIRTSTMVIGIRGTSGVVRAGNGDNPPGMYVLDGEVKLNFNEERLTVSAGEKAELVEVEDGDPEIRVTALTEAEIDAFAVEEIRSDTRLQGRIRKESGLDVDAILDASPKERRGNTVSNYAAGGYFAQYEGMLYYSFSHEDSNSIRRISLDGIPDDDFLIWHEPVYDLNILDGWIYYIMSEGAYSAEGVTRTSIMKRPLYSDETTELTELSGANNTMIVIDDWIYFTDSSAVCKIRTDGSEKMMFAFTQHIDRLALIDVRDGLIFYRITDWSDGGDLPDVFFGTMRTDGSEQSKVRLHGIYGNLQIVGDYFYFIGSGDNYENLSNFTIRRLKRDFSEDSLLYYSQTPISGSITVSGDWIYFAVSQTEYNYNNGDRISNIVKIPIDGGEPFIIAEDCSVGDITVVGDYVYWVAQINEATLGRVRTDGTELSRVWFDNQANR